MTNNNNNNILLIYCRVAAHQHQAKDKETQVEELKKKKGIEAQRAKPPTPPPGIDALIGDKEQNGKRRKKHGASPQPS